jgi:hypothetical protein
MSKPSNTPAFPVTRIDGDGISYNTHSGMTLRDWFAGMALQGILASCPEGMRTNSPTLIPAKEWAKAAYYAADAMLAEREKGTE